MAEAKTITIRDDGDDLVWFEVDGENIFEVNHDEHGWDGMTAAIGAVKAVAKATGIQVDELQDVV